MVSIRFVIDNKISSKHVFVKNFLFSHNLRLEKKSKFYQYLVKATVLFKSAKQNEASRAALKELVQSGQKIGLLRNALELMIRRYPQWGDEIKHAIQQGNPPVSRSMLQKPNAIVGNLEVRLVGVQGRV